MAKRLAHKRTAKLKQLVKSMLKMIDGKCYFCDGKFENVLKITVHHVNGDHSDNRKENLSLAHEKCHRSYHAKIILHGKP